MMAHTERLSDEWEVRDAGDGLSFIERGTGEQTERLLSVAIPYDDAERVVSLREALRDLTWEGTSREPIHTTTAFAVALDLLDADFREEARAALAGAVVEGAAE